MTAESASATGGAASGGLPDSRSGHDDFTIRLSTRRNATLFLAVFLLMLGVGDGRRPLAIGGAFLVAVIVADAWPRRGLLDAVRIRRRHFPRAFEGQQVTVELDIENPSPRPVHLFEASDCFPPGGAFFVRNVAIELPARSTLTFRYRQTVQRRRGLYLIGPLRLRSGSGLGLHDELATGHELTRLLVVPSVDPLRGFDLLGPGTHPNIGRETVRHTGRGEEFERLREYRPGDPLRLVHWPSTARLGHPVVKEFQRDIVTGATVFCDLHLLAQSGLGDMTSVEYRLRVAASVAADAIRRGHLTRVVAVKEPPEQTRLAGGAGHLAAVLDWMATLKPEGQGSFEAAVTARANRLTPGATAVLVTSSIHVDADALRGLLRLLRLRRVKAVLVAVDDRSFLKLRREQETLHSGAPTLDALLALARDEGATAFAVRNGDSIAHALAGAA